MNNMMQYVETLQSGLRIIERYGNWSVPPWVIKEYGFEKVRSDLQNMIGNHYDLRKYTYISDGVESVRNEYYIFEQKKLR